MTVITIDDTARFVSILSFTLDPGGASATASDIRHVVETRTPAHEGFLGSVVMLSNDKSQLIVVSLWVSVHAWSSAQYDHEIGRAISDAVVSAKSYEVKTYETVTLVRA
jgi:hypothetical protein